MPRRRRLSKAIIPDDVQFLDLHFGEWPKAFASPLARLAAYHRMRNRLLAECSAGQRPLAFWQYEAPERPRQGVEVRTWIHYVGDRVVTSELLVDESQADCLNRLGLLEDWERAELHAIKALCGGE